MITVDVHPPVGLKLNTWRLTDMLEKRAMEAHMVDEYVDIGDEMPTMNYHWQ
uniref:Uncharacterized protein n=1 Tax=Setaria viridis TaxID=4556 RepID=A0A4U6TLX6_SETVI|nr:hypothetical protein SEVIR_7G049600v2 [Setaria viridis]